jgi:diaminohydroxyphosphoribosylaminopyrimidine deaminase / 5-amino-6-(5-phosphoribosylamino)uracil reductase
MEGWLEGDVSRRSRFPQEPEAARPSRRGRQRDTAGQMSALTPEIWRRLLDRQPVDSGLSTLYGPLIAAPSESGACFVLARIAQSLDGRIATFSGASQWISGHEDIVHMHRLRALCDAIVIGAGTIRADNPQLTTREVEGPSPVRVVVDTNRKLDDRYRVFQDGPETLLFCAEDAPGPDRHGAAPVLRLPRAGGGLDIARLLAGLAQRGLRRIVVEGGGITISRFLAAGALDRLHVTVAPLLLGSGIPAFTLPEASTPSDGLRCTWTVHRLGDDVLLDIPLQRARPAVCR